MIQGQCVLPTKWHVKENMHDIPEIPTFYCSSSNSWFIWRFGDGYILLGFSAGYLVAISTHIREVGQELFQAKNHRDGLTDIALSLSLGQVASCGDNAWVYIISITDNNCCDLFLSFSLCPHLGNYIGSKIFVECKINKLLITIFCFLILIFRVKVHDMSNLQDTVTVHTLDGEGNVERVAWSEDGQLLAVSTRSGNLAVFLSCLPMLASVCGTKIAVLSSLNEVTLHSYNFEKVLSFNQCLLIYTYSYTQKNFFKHGALFPGKIQFNSCTYRHWAQLCSSRTLSSLCGNEQ